VPKEYIQAEVEEFRRKSFGEFTVGLQIRMRESFAGVAASVFWACVKEHMPPGAVVFVATDNHTAQEGARRAFEGTAHRLVYYRDVLEESQASGIRTQLRADADHTVVDHLLLAACDDLVVTSGSSYGRIAYPLLSFSFLVLFLLNFSFTLV